MNTTTELPLRNVAQDITDLLLLENAVTAGHPLRIAAKTGQFVVQDDTSTITRHGDVVVASIPSGAELRLNLRAIAFRGRLTGFRIFFVSEHPRILLEFAQPIDVARMAMSDRRNCDVVELRYEEP